MHRQRGIIAAIYLYGLAAVTIIGGIWYAYHYINTHWETSAGISRGEANTQAKWNDANRAAQAAADQERAVRAKLASEQSSKLAAAEGRAKDSDTRWRQARAAASRAKIPLLVENCDAPAGAVAGGAPVGAGLRLAATLRLTYQFLHEFDSAWSGADGQPVFGATSGNAQAPDATSPIDAASLLIVHAENASRCSANSRAHNALIDLLEKLQAR